MGSLSLVLNRVSVRAAYAIVVLASNGCAFTLDFDDLERCAECKGVDTCNDDRHVCVLNGCQPEPRDNPVCESPDASADAGSTPRCDGATTLSPFVEFTPVDVDVVLQAEVLTTKTRVYHAVYVEDDGKADIILRAFDTTSDVVGAPGTYVSPIAERRLSELVGNSLADVLGSSAGELVAPAALVLPRGFDEPAADAAGALTVYTAVAAAGASTAALVRLDLGPNWPNATSLVPLTVLPNFRINSSAGRSGPAAGRLDDGEPFVVWQGCKPTPDTLPNEADLCGVVASARTIYAHSGSEELTLDDLLEQGIAEEGAANSIGALSGGAQPAALWMTAGLATTTRVDVRAGVPSQPQAQVTELLQCDDPTGGGQWINTALVQGAVSSVVWSKASGTAEATRVQCLDGSCRELGVEADAGPDTECSRTLTNHRVFPDINYLAHGVWAASNADSKAFTVAAFVERDESGTSLRATVTQGLPDPNAVAIVEPSTERFEVTATNPKGVVLSMQQYDEQSTRAVVTVGWVDGTHVARLRAFDLCLPR